MTTETNTDLQGNPTEVGCSENSMDWLLFNGTYNTDTSYYQLTDNSIQVNLDRTVWWL